MPGNIDPMTTNRRISDLNSRLRAGVAAVALGVALGGCSYVPDWANPVAWYDGVFGDDDSDRLANAERAGPPPGQNESYPKLSSVPDQPGATTLAGERQQIARGLVSDRDNARYTDETLRGTATAGTRLSTRPLTQGTASSSIGASTAQPQAQDAGALRTATAQPDRTTRAAMPSIVQRRPSAPPAPPPPTAAPQVSAATAPVAAPPPVPAGAQQTAMVAPPPPPALPQLSTAPAAQPTPYAPQAAFNTPSVQVNLPVSPDQNTLNQVFNQHLAAQGNPTAGYAGDPALIAPGAGPGTPWAAQQPARPAYNQSVTFDQSLTDRPVQVALANPGDPLQGLSGHGSAPVAVIKFGHSSSRLTDQTRRAVRQVAETAKQHNGYVRVVGHASSRTTNMDYSRHKLINFNVSLDRAQTVAQQLARAGVNPQNILVEAVGDNQPIYYEFMPNGEAENRRVEIFLE